MRIKETKLYHFDELSEEAKQKAIEGLSDINTDYEWWESTYEDAENIGLKLTSFGLDRNRHATGEIITSYPEMAESIISEHGKDCETHKTAKQFLSDRDELVAKYSDGKKTDIVIEDNEVKFDNELDELEDEFLKSILEDYSIILQKDYEHLTKQRSHN